jgi:oligogalacturonide transporter
MKTQNREIKPINMAAYGCGDLFAGITGTTLGIWIFYFYTTVVGLSPIEAGSILAIARIWDGITDPTMGYITDNTRSRWG